MNRREFLSKTVKAATAGIFVPSIFSAYSNAAEAGNLSAIKPLFEGAGTPFKMKFSPRVGMDNFRSSFGKDVVERIPYYYANGFRSIEGCITHTGNKDVMDKIGLQVEKFSLNMGPQSSMNEKSFPTMTANVVPCKKDQTPLRGSKEIKEYLAAELDKVFDMLRRIKGNSFIIGPGLETAEISYAEQMKNTIENMKYCTELCEKNNAVMMIEPLNLISHKGMFFYKTEQALEVCEAINSPHCKILYDIFHEYMSVGNLNSLEPCIKHVGGFHIADAPSRMEPGTGIIDYPKVLKKISDLGYKGTLGLEHAQSVNTAEGDIAVLKIYKDLDKSV